MDRKISIEINQDGSVEYNAEGNDCPAGFVAQALNGGHTPSGRLIISLECSRLCKNCANRFPSVQKSFKPITMDELDRLKVHEDIVISGGEPMMYPEHTLFVIRKLKKVCPEAKIYLYTAKWSSYLNEIIQLIDGITYTTHFPDEDPKEGDPKLDTYKVDVESFATIQSAIRSWKGYYPGKNYRLFVTLNKQVPVDKRPKILIEAVWDRVVVDEMMSEEEFVKKCPDGALSYETLYLLKGESNVTLPSSEE
jgi:hypothetical protein